LAILEDILLETPKVTSTNLSDFRITAGPLRASRAKRLFSKPKPSNLAAKQGLRYENRVGKELQLHVNKGNFIRLEHNPWFTFSDVFGTNNCSPDFLLWTEGVFVEGLIIVEVKLTWVEEAAHKLTDLYCPVISAALTVPTTPLVICRNLTRLSPPAQATLRDALASPFRLLQWLDNGHILW
jgi:hypothetical protein